MKPPLHSWDLSPKEAVSLQRELAQRIILKDEFDSIRMIAGADCAFDDGGLGVAAVIVYRYPSLDPLERVFVKGPVRFPYIPGLLSFREGPLLLKAFDKLRRIPDLVLFDGQGIAHPRGIGIASHLGLLLDRPAIGCAKSRLVGEHREPGPEKGDSSPLEYKGKTVGAVLRTREGVSPIFVSPGHKISLPTAIRITMNCARRYRIPKPTREADLWVANLKKGERNL